MLTVMVTIAVVLLLIVIGLLVWLVLSYVSSMKDSASQAGKVDALASQVEAMRAAQAQSSDNIYKSLQDGQSSLTKSLQSSHLTLDKLNSQIGELKKNSEFMSEVGSDVRRLQQILSSPKLRGNMGEWSMENLLTQILPAESFKLQHTFKNGKKVDALISLSDFDVPVDAKFPLESFEAIVKAETDEAKERMRKQFLRDVIKHIDKIAGDYINPSEGTIDFALMYVPAENVYYEMAIKQKGDTKDILQYCMEKKVIAVSPNLLYVYLMTVVMGLHGMRIEKQAAEIRQNLNKLNIGFADFVNSFDTIGGHLRNAGNKYDEANKKLDKFGMNLTQIQRAGEGESE